MAKILICDPEEGIRESLKLILGDHYDLILTDEPSQCLDCLGNAKDVKLVLLDIAKAKDTDIVEKIKESKPNAKVIVIAGYKQADNATEAVRLGASGYFVKPFKSEEILSTVRNFLK